MLLKPLSKERRIQGNYVAFENESLVCKKGMLVIRDGVIQKIKDYDINDTSAVTLPDNEVMFPGLADLHTHHTYNMIPIWERPERVVHPWDNRFEWRWCKEYTDAIVKPSNILKDNWDKGFKDDTNGNVAYGDLLLYFAELQAVAGGSTVLQESAKVNVPDPEKKSGLLKPSPDSEEASFYYPFMKKKQMLEAYGNKAHLLLRSTGIPAELGIKNVSTESVINSVVDLFKPQKVTGEINPHIDTSSWRFEDSGRNWNELAGILTAMANGKNAAKGYIVHLAEGRSGNLCPDEETTDAYSKREFDELMNRLNKLKTGNPKITSEVIQKLHMNLIHACGVNIKDTDSYNFLKENKIGLIWSPVSNLLLYEDTPVFYDNIQNNDIVLGLGSDWSPSGSKHVWDECKFAYKYLSAKLNTKDKNVIKEDVLKMVTLNASKLVGSDQIGNIKQGGYADFFVLKSDNAINADKTTALDTFFNVMDDSVQFVMIAGNLIYGEGSYFDKFNTTGELIPSKVDSLKNKKVYIPKELRGNTSFNLADKINELDTKLAGVRSQFRSSEDEIYQAEIKDLEDRFAIYTPFICFDDEKRVKDKKKITEIVIRSGWILDGIQFVYDNDDSGHFHGGSGGTLHRYTLQEDEYITSFTGQTAKYRYSSYRVVSRIKIKTNKGQVISAGLGRGCSDIQDFSYTAETGKMIFSLSGSYGGYVSELKAEVKDI